MMSTDAEHPSNPNVCSKSESVVLSNLEQQFHQLLLESKYNETTIKTIQENLNISLKRNIELEHELETERLNKSMIKMELDSLVTVMNNSTNSSNNSDIDIKVVLKDCQHLANKMYKLQEENMELKHALSKANSQLSISISNQYKYTEKVNSFTSTMNSLQIQIQKLDKESNTIVELIRNCKILVRKLLFAMEYSKKLNKTQFDNIQNILKEVANVKSQIEIIINQNEKQQTKKTGLENTSCNQIHLEICMQLVGTLEAENSALHKSLKQIKEGWTSEDKIDSLQNK